MKQFKSWQVTLTLLAMPFGLFAQTGNNVKTNGNVLNPTDEIGSTNDEDVTFITNGQKHLILKKNGNLRLFSFDNGLDGLVFNNSNGTFTKTSLTGNSGDVLNGAGVFVPLNTLTAWTVAGAKVHTNKRVGINVSNPSVDLEVNGDVLIAGTLFATNIQTVDVVNAKKRIDFKTTMSMTGYDASEGTRNELWVNAGDFFLNSKPGYNFNTILNNGNSGNVGIGTDVPSAKLHVIGDSKFDGNVSFGSLSIGDYQITKSPSNSKLFVFGPAVTGPDLEEILPQCIGPKEPIVNAFQGIINSWGHTAYGGTINSMTMGFDGANGIVDVAGVSNLDDHTPKLLINYYCGKDVAICTGINGGIVSVGNNFEAGFPDRDLNVVTNIKAQEKTGLVVTSVHGESGINTLLKVNNVNTKALFVNNTSYTAPVLGGDVFQVYGNGNTFIAGKLGVGTTCIPGDYKMGVDGYIICEGVNVKLASGSGCWPDYVFDSNYKLMSLNEIEQYIKKYKHLPDLPSANEVEEKGIDLAETNKILVQKIEELTLLLIKMEKELDEVKLKIK